MSSQWYDALQAALMEELLPLQHQECDDFNQHKQVRSTLRCHSRELHLSSVRNKSCEINVHFIGVDTLFFKASHKATPLMKRDL